MNLRIEAAKLVLGCEPKEVEEQYNLLMEAHDSNDGDQLNEVPDDVTLWEPYDYLPLDDVVHLIDRYEKVLMRVWNEALLTGGNVALNTIARQIKK